MVRAWQAVIVFLGVWVVAQPSFNTPVEAQLSPFFYLETCPLLYPVVAAGVLKAIASETRNAAFILRLHFHDCFVQGCDASILLDGVDSEQNSFPNLNSIGGVGVINTIKASVEKSCPGVVSCADVLTLSAFYAVLLSGGPFWFVPLGRRDGFTSGGLSGPVATLPPPFLTFSQLQDNFHAQNLTDQDLVALSGAHTIGLARCFSIVGRIYNFTTPTGPDPTLNTNLLSSLKKICPFGGNGSVTTVMDLQTSTLFDNRYYQNLLNGKGLFRTDQDLFDRGTDQTKALVQLYASNQFKFFEDFSTSIVNLGNIQVLTGTEGEIRLNCSVRNPVDKSVIEQVLGTDSERKSETPETEENRLKKFGKAATLKRTDTAYEFFQQVFKLVAEEIAEEQREELVEDSVSFGHSSNM